MKRISLFLLFLALVSLSFCQSVFEDKKKECGYISIDQKGCEALGCIYVKTKTGSTLCYHKPSGNKKHNLRQNLKNSENTDIIIIDDESVPL